MINWLHYYRGGANVLQCFWNVRFNHRRFMFTFLFLFYRVENVRVVMLMELTVFKLRFVLGICVVASCFSGFSCTIF